MYKLYSMQRSGNCYKVRLALAQLGIPYQIVDIDILKGEARTPQFLSMNPSGRVPVLEVAPERYVCESNAILWYIAGGTPLAPEDRIDRSTRVQWMFFEQNSLEPYLARVLLAHAGQGRTRITGARPRGLDGKGYQAFGVMEKHLSAADFVAAAITPSPTSRSTATRTWRTNANSISRLFRRSAPGSTAWSISPATYRWTGTRRQAAE